MKVQILVLIAAVLAFVWGYRGEEIQSRLLAGGAATKNATTGGVGTPGTKRSDLGTPPVPSPGEAMPHQTAVPANPVAIPRPAPMAGDTLTNTLRAATPAASGDDIERRRSEYQQLQAERPPLPQQAPMGAIPSPILPPAVTNAIPPVDESAAEDEEIIDGDDSAEEDEEISGDEEEDLGDEADLGDEEDAAEDEGR